MEKMTSQMLFETEGGGVLGCVGAGVATLLAIGSGQAIFAAAGVMFMIEYC